MNDININERVNVDAYTSIENIYTQEHLDGLSTDNDIQRLILEHFDAIFDHFERNTSITQRSFTKDQFERLLWSFFGLTYDAYINRTLARRVGSHWNSMQDSKNYFIALFNLDQNTFERFFKAVQCRGEYSWLQPTKTSFNWW